MEAAQFAEHVGVAPGHSQSGAHWPHAKGGRQEPTRLGGLLSTVSRLWPHFWAPYLFCPQEPLGRKGSSSAPDLETGTWDVGIRLVTRSLYLTCCSQDGSGPLGGREWDGQSTPHTCRPYLAAHHAALTWEAGGHSTTAAAGATVSKLMHSSVRKLQFRSCGRVYTCV